MNSSHVDDAQKYKKVPRISAKIRLKGLKANVIEVTANKPKPILMVSDRQSDNSTSTVPIS